MTKQKIISLVVSCFMALALLASGVVVGVVCSKPQTTATTESATLTTNLFNTNGTINVTAAYALLDAVGYYD
ncbi:MAG: hypothetical protein J6C13_04070, partial [Clostridia bacterium]|nr:hypothetical protein [Clostridia bacterium]